MTGRNQQFELVLGVDEMMLALPFEFQRPEREGCEPVEERDQRSKGHRNPGNGTGGGKDCRFRFLERNHLWNLLTQHDMQ